MIPWSEASGSAAGTALLHRAICRGGTTLCMIVSALHHVKVQQVNCTAAA